MLARGAAVLAKSSAQSEEVTLNGVTVWANVNRTPGDEDPSGLKDVSTEEGSIIEYPLGGESPERGDILTDSYSFQHTVKSRKHIGHAYRLECKVLR